MYWINMAMQSKHSKEWNLEEELHRVSGILQTKFCETLFNMCQLWEQAFSEVK